MINPLVAIRILFKTLVIRWKLSRIKDRLLVLRFVLEDANGIIYRHPKTDAGVDAQNLVVLVETERDLLRLRHEHLKLQLVKLQVGQLRASL